MDAARHFHNTDSREEQAHLGLHLVDLVGLRRDLKLPLLSLELPLLVFLGLSQLLQLLRGLHLAHMACNESLLGLMHGLVVQMLLNHSPAPRHPAEQS